MGMVKVPSSIGDLLVDGLGGAGRAKQNLDILDRLLRLVDDGSAQGLRLRERLPADGRRHDYRDV